MVNYFDLWADLTSSNGAWRWWIAVQCTVSCLSSLSPDNPGCYRVLETAAIVLQKVTSEANPNVRNHGEGPY